MKRGLSKWIILLALLLAGGASLSISVTHSQADGNPIGAVLAGTVLDRQGQAVQGATVTVRNPGENGQDTGQGEDGGMMQAVTQADGRFILLIPEKLIGDKVVVIERAHFQTVEKVLTLDEVENLNSGEAIYLEDVVLARRIGPARFILFPSFSSRYC